MLVTDWVDGIGFDEVPRRPDAVRDRYAEIVYRFFYGTALALGLALGDPHPGNYLLCADGRVAFFDFGMIRRLPPTICAARRSSPAASRGRRDAVIRGMRELGSCPASPANGTARSCVDYMHGSRVDAGRGPLRLAPDDLWQSADVLREADGRKHIGQLRRMTLPPEALLLRRMEGLLFQTAACPRVRALG